MLIWPCATSARTASDCLRRCRQVRLRHGRPEEFQQFILRKVYERLLLKTQEMSLSELINYFDPEHNNAVRPLPGLKTS
eukprot:2779416-Pleurochrysis_carterae.AAC.1